MNNNFVKGFCTQEGTHNFLEKYNLNKEFYKTLSNGIKISSIGIGTYKGNTNENGDLDWEKSIITGVKKGFNVIDTAAKYRRQKSEIIIGKCIKTFKEDFNIRRESLFISTKGGLIGYPNNINTIYIDSYLRKLSIDLNQIYMKEFCMSPDFIKKQIEESRERLMLETIDCYYLHNPEILFQYKKRDEAYMIFESVFNILEESIKEGKIRNYGLASWNGLRRRKGNKFFLDVKRLLKIATKIKGKSHGFRFIQIPISVGMPYILKNGYLKEISELGFNIFTSASAYEGRLEELENLTKLFAMIGETDSPNEINPLKISFPQSDNSFIQLIELLQDFKKKNITLYELLKEISPDLDIYPAAINIIRSIPEIKCSLVGMQEPKFIDSNSILINHKFLNDKKLQNFFNLLKN